MLNQTLHDGRLAIEVVIDDSTRPTESVSSILAARDPVFNITGRWRRAGDSYIHNSEGFPLKTSDTEWLESIDYTLPVVLRYDRRVYTLANARFEVSVPERTPRHRTRRDPPVYREEETVHITVRGEGRFERYE